METLPEFDDAMKALRDLRTEVVAQVLATGAADPGHVAAFAQLHDELAALPRVGDRYVLRLDELAIATDLSYELAELRKDLVFLREGPQALLDHLAAIHRDFASEVDRVVAALGGVWFDNFVTDRDGTISNYCGRYASSIQAVYNAVFLTRFARACAGHAVVVTSAPLRDPGIVSVSTMPPGTVVFAASKARELLHPDGGVRTFPIDPAQQAVLDRFNARVRALVREPAYVKFSWIGSGVQFKFGETTLARQDHVGTIAPGESAAWRARIERLRDEVDPTLAVLEIVDTGLDLEVTLKTGDHAAFSKAHGLRFVDQALGLGLGHGRTLVCGDTRGDVPLLAACMEAGAEVDCVFVTRDDALARDVRAMCPRAVVVSEVDALVVALDRCAAVA